MASQLNRRKTIVRLEHSLPIKAPAEIVWSATIDVERWPAWNPNTTRVERLEPGAFGVGSTARIEQPGMPAAIWRVTEMLPERRFVWETRLLGMRMVGAHDIIVSVEGCTSRLTLTTHGLASLLLGPVIRRSATQAIRTENAGLCDWCQRAAQEAQAAT
jgi:Polyketide cyclase / dehydrase and lipid transport